MSLDDLRATWTARDPAGYEDAANSAGRVAAIARAAELMRGRVHPSDVVLDVGCGVGLLAAHLPGQPLIGVDFSASLLGVGKDRLPVLQASAFALPIRAGSVALVACLFLLDDYDPTIKRRTLTHLASALRSRGHLLLAGYAPDDDRMGPRRHEVSARKTPVYLEDEPFYQQALAVIGDEVSVEHLRLTVHPSAIHGVQERSEPQPYPSPPMQRHFIIASVRTR